MSQATECVLSTGVNLKIVLYTIASTRQRDASYQQYEQYHIGKCGSKVNHLQLNTDRYTQIHIHIRDIKG